MSRHPWGLVPAPTAPSSPESIPWVGGLSGESTYSKGLMGSLLRSSGSEPPAIGSRSDAKAILYNLLREHDKMVLHTIAMIARSSVCFSEELSRAAVAGQILNPESVKKLYDEGSKDFQHVEDPALRRRLELRSKDFQSTQQVRVSFSPIGYLGKYTEELIQNWKSLEASRERQVLYIERTLHGRTLIDMLTRALPGKFGKYVPVTCRERTDRTDVQRRTWKYYAGSVKDAYSGDLDESQEEPANNDEWPFMRFIKAGRRLATLENCEFSIEDETRLRRRLESYRESASDHPCHTGDPIQDAWLVAVDESFPKEDATGPIA